ncbi:MAG: diguanylate cyclase [Candidatus Eisenbacteria bacterium]|uniref:Diguanylate cyclase n=1 Tax=Eiseniibacteriota bacterium TaxID=2212470 RepID=A0A956SGH9_UNCEI|nr:diguanylate cyclase [Candidatus Eisenbacteria bacterium]
MWSLPEARGTASPVMPQSVHDFRGTALGWLTAGSDVIVFAACVVILAVFAMFVRRRSDVPFPRLLWVSAAFILAFATVHLLSSVRSWIPVDEALGIAKLGAAVVSVLAAITIVPVLPRVLALPDLQHALYHFASIVETSNDAIMSKSLDGTILTWNPGAERMYGYAAEEVVGRNVSMLVPPERQYELQGIMERLARGEHVGHFDTERLAKDGQRISVSLSVSPVLDARGEIIAASAIARDIREQKLTERTLKATAMRLRGANRRLRALADHDPLTGLLNRRGLEAALVTEVERIRRQGSRAAAILIDCDDFKQVNESFGHDGGDEVLREVAERIREASREPDRVARLGGDEFMILTPDTRVGEAVLLAQRVGLAVAKEPVALPLGDVQVRISCGVEPIDPNEDALEPLVARTSSTLAQSKRAGKNRVTAGLGDQDGYPDKILLEPFAQSIVEVGTGRRVGIEFLIRGPKGRLHMPSEIFGVSREQGTLTEVDIRCLRRCAEVATGLDRGLDLHVNVFPSTLLEVDVPILVDRISEFGCSDKLCLELNEVMLVGDPIALAPRAQELRARTGCHIAIDDVGFGRSSLEALILLEPDVLKIDRGFVHGAYQDLARCRHLERVLNIGRSLGARVIAEGVESAEDRDVLQEFGVELAQGFFWGRPASLREPEPALG